MIENKEIKKKRKEKKRLVRNNIKKIKNTEDDNNNELRNEFSGFAVWFAQSGLVQRALESEADFVQWAAPYADDFDDAYTLIGDFIVETERHPITNYRNLSPAAYSLVVLDSFLEDHIFHMENAAGQGVLDQLKCLEAFFQIDLWKTFRRAELTWIVTHREQAQDVLNNIDVDYFFLPHDQAFEQAERCQSRAHQERCMTLSKQLATLTQQQASVNTFFNDNRQFFDNLLANQYDGRLADYIESWPGFKSLIYDLAMEKDAQLNLYRLIQGFSDWRLPLLVWLHKQSAQQFVKNALSVLGWLNKYKTFFKNAIDRDSQFNEWLQEDSRSHDILQKFTARCAELSPELIDVRTLAYTLGLLDHRGEYCDTILSLGFSYLIRTKQLGTYQVSYPNAVVSLSLALSGTMPDNDAPLSVTPETLLCLTLVHPDNTKLVALYQSNIPVLEHVIGKFEQYKVSQENKKATGGLKALLANSLHGSMSGGKSVTTEHAKHIAQLESQRELLLVPPTKDDKENDSPVIPVELSVKF